MPKLKKLEELLISIALKHAKEGKGCILVIMKNKFDYSLLLGEDIKPFNVFDNQRRLSLLSSCDGACIINPEGQLIAYSANILNVKSFSGWGTRHSASATASQNGNIAIISSEEDHKARIFRDGKLVMELDPFSKSSIEEKVNYASEILESAGAGVLGTISVSLIYPTIGLSLISGLVVFGTVYSLFKNQFRRK